MNTNFDNRFLRHRGPVTGTAVIPNTQSVITSGYDGAVGFFELDTRKVRLLGHHKHLVNRVAVSESGRRAAAASADYSISLWDLRTLKPEKVLLGHRDDVEDFVFVDDSTGASTSQDRRIIVWNLETGAISRIIDAQHQHYKGIMGIQYHNGKLYTSGDTHIFVWDLETGELAGEWGLFDREADTCAVDPRYNRVFLGCDDGVIYVFDIETGKTTHEIKAHSAGIKKVAVSPVTGDVLSAAYDQKILIWDAKEMNLKVSLEGKLSIWERSFNWSPDGTRVVAGTFDGSVLVWDAHSGKLLDEIGDQDEEKGNACFNDVAANKAGDIALVSDDGYVRLGHLTPAKAEWITKVEPASGRMLMNAVTFDDTYSLVAGGAHNQKLHIYDKVNGSLQNEVEVFLGEGPINTIRMAHHPGFEGDLFVGCYTGAIVRVSNKGEIKDTFYLHDDAVKALRIHSEKPIGVSCSANRVLLSWDLNGKLIHRFPGHTSIVDDVDIDPTGNYIASVSRDFTLKVYNLFDGTLCHSIAIGLQSPKAVCFWDEQTVIVTNYWGMLFKADLSSGKVLRRQIARNGISGITPNGEHLVAVSYDGAAYLVHPDDLRVVQSLRAMTQRPEMSSIG